MKSSMGAVYVSFTNMHDSTQPKANTPFNVKGKWTATLLRTLFCVPAIPPMRPHTDAKPYAIVLNLKSTIYLRIIYLENLYLT